MSLKWSSMLKVSVLGVLLAAGLLAPQAAHANGRNAQTPNIFAEWREAGAGGEAAPSLLPYRSSRTTERRAGTSRYASGRANHYAWRQPIALRRYSVASLRPIASPLPSPSFAPASFGGGDVVAEAARWIGSGKFTGQPGPWCADAVSAWLERSGHRPLDGRMASSALANGPRLERPEVGALAVLGGRRGWASHVGVVSSVDRDGSIRLISGNWGRRVAEAVVPRGSVIAFVAVR
jgi:uncharacterized protein (TIGR02594 family)